MSKSDEAPRVKLEAVMVTDVGVVRDHNEDAAYLDPEHAFFIVADGMGGHAAGEVASAMAVETVKGALAAARNQIKAFAARPTEQGRRDLVQLLQSAVLAAHQAVFQRGTKETDKQGMGTTLDVLLVAGNEAFVAHVGDSRTYLVRDGRASQITTDHTVAEVLVIEGKLSIEEAQVSPLRTILVNAIGVSADVGVEMAHLQLRRDDRMLVCSDGLHDYFLAEEEIAERLVPPHDQALDPALRDMVEIAKERGGHDNITGIALRVVELPDAVPAPIEPDETQPVDASTVAAKAPGWDEEHTETAATLDHDHDIENAPTLPPGVQPPPGIAAAGKGATKPPGSGDSLTKSTQPLRIVRPGSNEEGAAADGDGGEAAAKDDAAAKDKQRKAELSRANTVPPEIAAAKKEKEAKDKDASAKDASAKDASAKDGKDAKAKKPRSRSSKPPTGGGAKTDPPQPGDADTDPGDDDATLERAPVDDK